MGTRRFLSLFHEHLQIRLMEMRTEQLQQVLWPVIGVALYRQSDEGVHNMFPQVFGDNKEFGSPNQEMR